MPQESIKILLFFIYWNRWRIYSQGFRTPPKFISHHSRPLIFIALTLEKTNTGNLGTELFLLRNIPSSQRRRRETLVSPACLPCPWESSHMCCHGHTSERAAPDLGAAGNDPAQPSALRNRQQRGGWGAEGKGGRPLLDTASAAESLWFVGRRRRTGERAAWHSTATAGICSHFSSGGTLLCKSTALEASACLRETSLTDILHK